MSMTNTQIDTTFALIYRMHLMPQDQKKKIRTGLLALDKALGPRASLELGLHSIGTHWSPHSNEALGPRALPYTFTLLSEASQRLY
jgi:hypothetical protein